ncbi:MAG TPA: hypothetical protein VLA04_01235, partial [Verrucomicrobiae bacterium]|nr:hypothetical protein [Verrucomicrobiae bacterium]
FFIYSLVIVVGACGKGDNVIKALVKAVNRYNSAVHKAVYRNGEMGKCVIAFTCSWGKAHFIPMVSPQFSPICPIEKLMLSPSNPQVFHRATT